METAYDYDHCVYYVERIGETPIIKFAFVTNCGKAIMENGGEEMIKELYSGKFTCSYQNRLHHPCE